MGNLKQQRGYAQWAISLVAVAFGLLTIKEGGTVLFGDSAARLAAGNYVPFVLWFNFLAGFAYVIAGIGLWLQKDFAAWLAAGIAVANLFIFILLGGYIYNGGAYELRTVIAMAMRSTVWLVIATVAWRGLMQAKHSVEG
ncbi:MAG TPA: hypothetical protein VGE50_07065 [Gammaproteobacteria bacterium]